MLDNLGNVDVALEKNGCPSIACEISVTTPADHEVGNIQKCLAAGFDHVLLVASEKKILNQIRVLISTGVSRDQSARVHVVLPDQVFVCIASLEAKTVTVQVIEAVFSSEGTAWARRRDWMAVPR